MARSRPDWVRICVTVAAASSLVVLVLVAGAPASDGGAASAGPERAIGFGGQVGPGLGAAREGRRARLKTFDSCSGLRHYARRHHQARLRRLRARRRRLQERLEQLAADGAPVPAPPTPALATAPVPGSQTNVQEEGIDEPDIVKRDGSLLFVLDDGRLHAIDATEADPRRLDSLTLPEGPGRRPYTYGARLLIAGGRALVISHSYMDRAPWTRTILTEVEVGDPASLRAVRTLTIEGEYVSGRLSGETARLVLAEPSPIFLEHQHRRLGGRRSVPAPHRPAWLPQAVLRDRRSGRVVKLPLLDCNEVSRPGRFSGLDLLTVLTINLPQGLLPVDADAVMTRGETVYASPDALYVANERWHAGAVAEAHGSEISTLIHKFDAADPGETEYVASGEVPGYMLSQWSMSERDGLLRVASTTLPPWRSPGPRERAQSFVTVLEPRGRRLAEVGRVGGLGRGERIYAVRFIEDLGFVVTFREVDPLYTIDLSDPAHPREVGKLKVPGYSSYLHPVGDGLLLGVGEDVSERGRLLGAQLSLFDVTDASKPARLSKMSLGRGAHSEAEHDHHAFLYWPASELAVLPLEVRNGRYRRRFEGAIALRVGAASGIERMTRIVHGLDPGTAVRRAVVAGERLLTLSGKGVMAHDLDTLDRVGWLRFGGG